MYAGKVAIGSEGIDAARITSLEVLVFILVNVVYKFSTTGTVQLRFFFIIYLLSQAVCCCID